jgi:hypothetical protein
VTRGAVVHGVHEVDDVEAWRAAIRRQARADRIKIRTGFNEGVMWAMLARVPRSEELAAARRYSGSAVDGHLRAGSGSDSLL